MSYEPESPTIPQNQCYTVIFPAQPPHCLVLYVEVYYRMKKTVMHGGSLLSFEIAALNLNMSLKNNLKFNLNLN